MVGSQAPTAHDEDARGADAPDAATVPADGDSTRRRLVEAAATVFAERGYDGARVQEIARRAGLTTGAIYANFSGKADLLLAVVTEMGGRELDDLILLAGRSTDSGESPSMLDLLVDLGASLAGPDDATAHQRESALLFEAFAAARRDPDVAKFLVDHVDGQQALLRAVVTIIKDSGELADAVEPDAFVRFCQVLAVGSLVLDAVGVPPVEPAAWRALLERIADAARP